MATTAMTAEVNPVKQAARRRPCIRLRPCASPPPSSCIHPCLPPARVPKLPKNTSPAMQTAFFSHGDDSDDGRDEMQVDAEGEKQALEYVERVHKFPGMACYFANLLPVETASTIAVYDGNTRSGILFFFLKNRSGILVSEIVDYPVKALVFIANNINTLVNVVSEVSFILHDNSTTYSLLISNNGTKVFLFPQVKNLVTGCSLSAWECSGYFVYHTKFDFDRVSETEISNRMASVWLQDGSFEELKNLCCAIADDLAM